MRKSVFGIKRAAAPLRLNPLFIEIAVIIPIFAVCCCSVLYILRAAAERADREQCHTAALACAESWCELYGATGELELSARELFGDEAAESCINGMEIFIPMDSGFSYDPEESTASVRITESIEECERDGLVYGNMCRSEIHILWADGEIRETAAHYAPYPTAFRIDEE